MLFYRFNTDSRAKEDWSSTLCTSSRGFILLGHARMQYITLSPLLLCPPIGEVLKRTVVSCACERDKPKSKFEQLRCPCKFQYERDLVICCTFNVRQAPQAGLIGVNKCNRVGCKLISGSYTGSTSSHES